MFRRCFAVTGPLRLCTAASLLQRLAASLLRGFTASVLRCLAASNLRCFSESLFSCFGCFCTLRCLALRLLWSRCFVTGQMRPHPAPMLLRCAYPLPLFFRMSLPLSWRPSAWLTCYAASLACGFVNAEQRRSLVTRKIRSFKPPTHFLVGHKALRG